MKACASIREELRVAIRLGIKVSYDSTLRRCAEMIQRRGPSFHEPMRSWTTCPDPRYENDCLQLFDAFLADVERVTRHTQDTVIDLKDQDSLQAHAMHVSTVGRPWTTRTADKPKREGNPSPSSSSWQCAGCTAVAGDEQKKRQLDRNKKLRELKGKDFRPPAWLCGKCYGQLREKGQIRLNNGQTRQWITRSSANVAEDTSEQPAAKGSKKKGKTPKKSNDLDDALLQQHKDLVSN